MDHEDMYEKLCEPAFKELRLGINEVLRILKGANGDAGLCDKVRDHEKVLRWAWKAGVFLCGAVTLQFIIWLFKTIPDFMGGQ